MLHIQGFLFIGFFSQRNFCFREDDLILAHFLRIIQWHGIISCITISTCLSFCQEQRDESTCHIWSLCTSVIVYNDLRFLLFALEKRWPYHTFHVGLCIVAVFLRLSSYNQEYTIGSQNEVQLFVVILRGILY